MKPVTRLAVLLVAFAPSGSPRLSAAALPQETIDRAVERGVAALRRFQTSDGSFSRGTYGSGPTSLAALALLECNASPTDEQVLKAAAFVRNDCPAMNRTYLLSLAILLFDRLGDPQDEPIIQTLTVRLLEAQASMGGWGYYGPDVSPSEANKLKTLVEGRVELKSAPAGTLPSPRLPLEPEVIDRLKRLEQGRNLMPEGAYVDNSNTQFALLGAWVGRRHGIPTDFALRRAEAYFRATNDGGIWPYTPRTQTDDRAANTCSGLLGLAIGAGVVREGQLRTQQNRKDGKSTTLHDPLKDPMVQMAMNYVGLQIAQVAASGLLADINRHRNLYFLWSAERVAMAYSVPHMGGVDWYQKGGTCILTAQQPDGAWAAGSVTNVGIPSDVNTCFALLFLKRSNLVIDLTANLKNKPNQSTLHSGGEKSETQTTSNPALVASTAESERLVRELPNAAPARQEAIIAELRDGKGAEFTDALGHVIPTLAGAIQKKARDALAERLARMTAATVRAKLKDDDAEVRRAATLACAMKEDKALIGDLIPVLDDKDIWVVRGAAVALRSLTGQDFGPSLTATSDERAKAVAAWKGWWKAQKH